MQDIRGLMAQRRRMYERCNSKSSLSLGDDAVQSPREETPIDAALQNCSAFLDILKKTPQKVIIICVFVSQMNIES